MNHKQMVLVEFLVDHTINLEQDYNYKLIYKIDGTLYKGNFLQIDKQTHKFTRRYGYRLDDGAGYHKEFDIFGTKEGFTQDDLRMDFRAFVGAGSQTTKNTLLKNPSVLLAKMLEFVSKLDVDLYFNEALEYVPAIYDLTNIYTLERYDFYLVDDENIQVKFLDKIENIN